MPSDVASKLPHWATRCNDLAGSLVSIATWGSGLSGLVWVTLINTLRSTNPSVAQNLAYLLLTITICFVLTIMLAFFARVFTDSYDGSKKTKDYSITDSTETANWCGDCFGICTIRTVKESARCFLFWSVSFLMGALVLTVGLFGTLVNFVNANHT